MRNLYKVLGIASTADDRRIKSAFRHRAKAVHPDLNPGSARAEERFKELMQAYQVLRDARARAAYDGFLVQQRRESRARFAQSATVMAATFVLTTASAAFVMGLHGMGVSPESWQLAAAWRPSIEIEVPMAASGTAEATGETTGGTPFATTVVASTTAESSEPTAPAEAQYTVRSRKTGAEAVAKAQRRVAAAAPNATPAIGAPARQESSWPWPTADEPHYGLGASHLK